MQIQLPNESLVLIVRSLELRAMQSGPKILGSQLGVLVNQVVFPLSCRDFGGLKQFVETHLSQYVKGLGVSVEANDHHYQIVIETSAAKRGAKVPLEAQKVLGDDLWRFYSNPNLLCAMASIAATGEVVIAPTADLLPANSTVIRRVNADEYQLWAEDFAKTHSLTSEYEKAAATKDFYKAWIPMLRKASADVTNFLKSWEIFRAEKVAQHLIEELGRSGIESSRVAEIVQLARPIVKPIRAEAYVSPPTSTQEFTKPHVRSAVELPVVSEINQVRQLLHRAIEVMPLEELREIRVSAGVWMKISDKFFM